MRCPDMDCRNCAMCSRTQASSSSLKWCGTPSAPPSLVIVDRPHSGYFAPVGQHGERKGDDEDADAPGESDPNVVSNRLLLEQGSDRVDNRGDRLVFCEGAHGTWH